MAMGETSYGKHSLTPTTSAGGGVRNNTRHETKGMDVTKIIAYDDYLKAKGLWHLAVEARKEYDVYSFALCELIGGKTDGHIDDSIFYDNGTLEKALHLEGFDIAEKPA